MVTPRTNPPTPPPYFIPQRLHLGPIVDRKTLGPTREFYRWLLNLFQSVGSGQANTNLATLADTFNILLTARVPDQSTVGNSLAELNSLIQTQRAPNLQPLRNDIDTLAAYVATSREPNLQPVQSAIDAITAYVLTERTFNPQVLRASLETLSSYVMTQRSFDPQPLEARIDALAAFVQTTRPNTATLSALVRQVSDLQSALLTSRSFVPPIVGPGSGTVTSVALTMPSIFSVAGSPITSSGTLAVTLATETANTLFAGPTTGGAATPTFRALVNADMPSSGAGSGTVTSVGLSLPAIFSVSGSPVTASGTITATLATETANTVFAGPTTGIPAAPTFRALVASDIPGLTGLYLPLTVTTAQTLTFNTTLPASGSLWNWSVSQAADAGGTSNLSATANNYQVTGSNNAGTHLALSTIAFWSSTGTVTAFEAGRFDLRADNGGTITTGSALNAIIRATGTSSTIGAARGLNVTAPVVNTGGAITTATGAKIAGMKVTGVTTGIALASDGASDYSYFAGTVSVGKTTSPLITLDADGPIGPKSYTRATLPSVSAKAGQMVYCSDLGGGAGELFSDGTNWYRVQDGYLLRTTSTGAVTWTYLTDANVTFYNTALVGAVTVTLATTDSTGTTVKTGTRVRFIRGAGATGASTFTVNGKSLGISTFNDSVFDGSAWQNIGTGSI